MCSPAKISTGHLGVRLVAVTQKGGDPNLWLMSICSEMSQLVYEPGWLVVALLPLLVPVIICNTLGFPFLQLLSYRHFHAIVQVFYV